MKKSIAIFSLIAFAVFVVLPQAGFSQSDDAPAATGGFGNAIKNRILVAVNLAELSLEQLTTLQGIVQSTIEAQDAVHTAQAALQEFLIAWTGSAEEFEVAFEAEQQKIATAVEALQTLKASNAETIKDTLTASQFEVMQAVLIGVTGSPNLNPRNQATDTDEGRPQFGNRGPDNDNQNQGRNSNQPRGRQGGPGGPRRGGAGNLDVLNEVLTEKIAALQA